MNLRSENFDEFEKRAKKCRKYEKILDLVGNYALLIIILPLLLAIIYAGQIGRESPLPSLEVVFWFGVGIAIWFIPMRVFSNKVSVYRLDDDEWAKFYTHSIVDNLEKYFKAKTTGLKKDYRKKALKNAKDFLSCIEKKWKVGSFKLVKTYVGDAVSNLKKNIKYRVIYSLKVGDDELLRKVRGIMYNFLHYSRKLTIESINTLNDQMAERLPSSEPLKMGFYAKCLRFFRTHRILRHALVVSGFATSCVVLGYIAITYFEISKEAVWGGIILLFTALLAVYFAKQPKAE